MTHRETNVYTLAGGVLSVTVMIVENATLVEILEEDVCGSLSIMYLLKAWIYLGQIRFFSFDYKTIP